MLNKRFKIDCVIACQLPLASSAAGVEFKKIAPNAKFFIYELDSFWSSYYIANGWKKIFRKKCKKIERQFFDNADAIFHLECNREKYEDSFYERYNEKSYYLDIPLINKRQYLNHVKMDKSLRNKLKRIKLIYAGNLSDTFRKPNYIIKLIKEVTNSLPCELIFYSRGCENKLKREADENECIKSYGYVARTVLEKEIVNSDYLISIGNSLPERHSTVPSKIFEYMSTGKPIIHILAANDICKKYFEKYPMVLLIDPGESFERNLKVLKQFLIKNKGESVPFDVVSKAFKKNTPKYSVDLIETALSVKDATS